MVVGGATGVGCALANAAWLASSARIGGSHTRGGIHARQTYIRPLAPGKNDLEFARIECFLGPG
jgi:hypothetical protein